MDMSELANKMLEWETLISAAAKLEAEIKEAVLTIGKTQTVGNVRASYSEGRRSFDYSTPGSTAAIEIIEEHTVTQTTMTTDWKQVCKVAGIDPLVVSQSDPSVNVKFQK